MKLNGLYNTPKPRARGKRRGPRSRRASQESDQSAMLFLPILFERVPTSPSLFPFLRSDISSICDRTSVEVCPFSDFGSRRRAISRKTEKNIKQRGQKSVWTVARLLWRAAAPGLMPLSLPRAQNAQVPRLEFRTSSGARQLNLPPCAPPVIVQLHVHISVTIPGLCIRACMCVRVRACACMRI